MGSCSRSHRIPPSFRFWEPPTSATVELPSPSPTCGEGGDTPGCRAGAERVTLTANTMPVHGHSAQGQMKATTFDAETDEPAGKVLAKATRGDVYGDPANLTDMASQSVSVTVDDNAGAGQPHENMQPYQVVNFIIALVGLYPSRS